MEKNAEITSNHWKPTEAQRAILEQMFKQDQRNLTRTRIKEITNILKKYGDVDSKNVFSWFQSAEVGKKQKRKRNSAEHNSFDREDNVARSSVDLFSSSPCSAPVITLDSGVRMSQFSSQVHTNSSESTATQTVSSIRLFGKECLVYPNNDAKRESVYNANFQTPTWNNAPVTNDKLLHCFSERTVNPGRMDVSIARQPQEFRRKLELLELFPLRPDGMPPSFQPEHTEVANDGCLRRFSERTLSPPRKYPRVAREPEEYGPKPELLELFPSHPEGNLRSRCFDPEM